MEKLQGTYEWLGRALDRLPKVKIALKVTLINLTLMILSIPFVHPDNPWTWAAIVLIVVLDCVGFIIPNDSVRHRSRR
ncbi:MAG: hypothetical protein M3P51_17605 [Chloroflexota bacterium]|nr:hypothetical protein [Chloroflexota bacterium]